MSEVKPAGDTYIHEGLKQVGFAHHFAIKIPCSHPMGRNSFFSFNTYRAKIVITICGLKSSTNKRLLLLKKKKSNKQLYKKT